MKYLKKHGYIVGKTKFGFKSSNKAITQISVGKNILLFMTNELELKNQIDQAE